MPAAPRLSKLIVSAPFGNYVQPEGFTPTVGTFTFARRRGRVRQILRTVRWYPGIGAWVNKIGLRNPGLSWYLGKADAGRARPADALISIHGFNAEEWSSLVERAAAVCPLGMELNMSCPNVGSIDWPEGLFAEAVQAAAAAGAKHPPLVVVKLPPVNWELMAERAVEQGVRVFHCCNTLPVPRGGVSGKPLMPVALAVVRAMRRRYGDDVTLIGGGGITTPADLRAYEEAGADHFAVGTKVMSPRYLISHRGLRHLRAAAGVNGST